jgi:uncharacterized repeat protein (TIGR01451 family)
MNQKKILISSSRTVITILMCVSIFTTILPTASAGKRAPANPSISIELSVWDGAQWVDADSATGPNLLSGTVSFKVLVTNNGDVDLSKISITDTVSGTLTKMRKMAVAETWQQTYNVDWVSNQQMYSASVEAVYKGKSYSDTDSAYYFGFVPAPGIQVVKTANLGLAVVGETVTYTFAVTNPGNVPLDTVSVVDDVAGSATLLSGDTANTGYLDHGETWVYTATHTVESAPDPLVNTVTAKGHYDSTEYSDTDTYSLDVTEPGPTPITLTSPNAQTKGNFGEGVAIGDGYIAVGAYYEDIDFEEGPWSAGRVYVYNSETRELLKVLTSPNQITDGQFGYVVAINEGYLLVGAPYEDGAGYMQGAAYVYSLDDLDADPIQLTSPTAYATDGGEFGISLTTDGTHVFVGAESETVDDTENAGAVHVFEMDGTYVYTYTQPTPEISANYGCTIVVYETRLYVGASSAEQDWGGTMYNTGAVYVHDLESTELIQTIRSPMFGSEGRFGVSLAATADYLIVGAYREWVWGTTISSPGLVHIFDATTFEPEDVIESPNPTEWGQFGLEVATDGTYLVVSADHEGTISHSGKAYVYTLTDIAATPIVLASPNPETNGNFGTWYSVDISGGTVVIGAPGEADSVYDEAGHAYIFSLP